MTYYQGGKNRIGGEIADVILDNSDSSLPYFEPFCGMIGVGKWIMEDSLDEDTPRKFTFCDFSEDIQTMWKEAKNGWKPPTKCPGNAFNKLKHSDELSARRTFIGHACAFNGNFFSTHRCVHLKKDGVKPQAERVSLIGDLLYDVNAKLPNARSYSKFHPTNSIIYCDPPYKGNKLNGGINRKDFMDFDSEKFWDVMNEWVDNGNTVFVSELKAPKGWKAIWTKTYKVRPALETKTFKEKLFIRSY